MLRTMVSIRILLPLVMTNVWCWTTCCVFAFSWLLPPRWQQQHQHRPHSVLWRVAYRQRQQQLQCRYQPKWIGVQASTAQDSLSSVTNSNMTFSTTMVASSCQQQSQSSLISGIRSRSKRRINNPLYIRPATLQDMAALTELLTLCYSTTLAEHYDASVLAQSMSVIGTPRTELIQAGTYYCVEIINATAAHSNVRAAGCNDDNNNNNNNDNNNNTNSNNAMLVGCGGWSVGRPEAVHDEALAVSRSRPQLRQFAVHPEYIHQGIGRSLWEHVLQEIQHYYYSHHHHHHYNDKMNTTTTSHLDLDEDPVIEVFSSVNSPAFYQSLGFTYIEDKVSELVPGCWFPFVVLRRYPPSHESTTTTNT